MLRSPLDIPLLTEWDVLDELLLRLFFLTELPDGILVKDGNYDPATDDWYDFFVVNSPHTKPTKQDITDELEEYKIFKTQEFNDFISSEYYSIQEPVWGAVGRVFGTSGAVLVSECKKGNFIDALNIAIKEQKFYDARNAMNVDIFSEMLDVFKTDDPLSAITFAESWKMKKDYASEYLGGGLLAIRTVPGFSLGDPLDTEQKIIDFYTEMVKLLVEFDKFRDNRIAQYLSEKAAIEAS